MRKKIRSIHIILFVMLFLIGSFIDISTIEAEQEAFKLFIRGEIVRIKK